MAHALDAVLLFHPLAALLLDGLGRADRLAHLLADVLHARLDAIGVGRAALLLHAGFADRPARLAADFLVASLADRHAVGFTDLAAALLADLLASLTAGLVADHFLDRTADGGADFLLAALRHLLADGVAAFLVAGLAHRLADRLTDLLVGGLVARPADRFLALLPAGRGDRPLADGLLVAPAGLVASAHAGLALLAVAGLADLLHDGLLHRLVGRVPALLHDVVPDQLVAGLHLLLAGREAGLGVAAGLRATAVVTVGAEMRRPGALDGPKQADQYRRQRRPQAHPHDWASSIDSNGVESIGAMRREDASFDPSVPGPPSAGRGETPRCCASPDATSLSRLLYRQRLSGLMTPAPAYGPCAGGVASGGDGCSGSSVQCSVFSVQQDVLLNTEH